MTIQSIMTEKTLKQMEKITGKLTLGKLIWSIRQCEGITQVNFAKSLKITKQHLSDIEHGRKVISPTVAAQYAAILAHSPEQFIRLALQE